MNTPNTIEDIAPLFHEELKDLYPKEELDTFVILTVSDLFGISRDEIRVRRRQPLNPKEVERISTIITELKTQKPIQYILGRTDFYGCKIRVNEHVLIPRPETEELVDFILQGTKDKGEGISQINILDIGTGSGCIAIALKKNLPEANVSAIDISEEALLIAKANAILNHTKINFLQADILSHTSQAATSLRGDDKDNSTLQGGGHRAFDLIVSNPPYVRASEKEKMSKNVLDYEPHLALFVKDNDPLLFYKAISEFAKINLTPNGSLFFEINEALGSDVKKLLEEKGFMNAEIKKDMSGKERFAIGNI